MMMNIPHQTDDLETRPLMWMENGKNPQEYPLR